MLEALAICPGLVGEPSDDDAPSICPSHGLPTDRLRPHGFSRAWLCPECDRMRNERSLARFEALSLPADPCAALVVLFVYLATVQ